ncbi:MAG: 2OG-Fe(II) oxygenase [Parvularculaceae bacterium]
MAGGFIGFELMVAAMGVLSDSEVDALVAHCDRQGGAGLLSGGLAQDGYRRSTVAWARRDEGFGWLYDRVWDLARGFNDRFFAFEITGIEKALQIARYDADVAGGYDWHTDFGIHEPTRKLSLSVQLSRPTDYDGGDLEFDLSSEPTPAGRDRGLAIAFPSFVRHRVAPVTKGARYSLVAWINGPRYR